MSHLLDKPHEGTGRSLKNQGGGLDICTDQKSQQAQYCNLVRCNNKVNE